MKKKNKNQNKNENKNENILVKFIFDGSEVNIDCKRNEYMKDIIKQYTKDLKQDLNNIYFLYKGDMLNQELKIEEINKYEKEIKILVYEIEEQEKIEEKLKESEDIVCPGCKEVCILNINNYKFNLSNCKNNHCFSNIIISEFNDLQKIDQTEIVCHKCNQNKLETSNNKFFICIDCNENYCPLCKSFHNKNHKIIDYEMKNFNCYRHGEGIISYNNKNNENLCDMCNYS